MSLTGTALVSTLLVFAIALPILLLVLWRRTRVSLGRTLVGFVGIVVCQLLAISAAGVVANNQFGFYDSWSDLIGSPNTSPLAAAANGLVPSDRSQGRVITLAVALPGPQRHHRMTVVVWVPREYDEPQYHHTQFPVTMMLPGQPNTPQGVFNEFHFGVQATAAIKNHIVLPFVAVFPPIMIDPPRDTECTDVPGGPQARTWLVGNVRRAVIHNVRVSSSGSQWSAMGWSTGGFCAAKLMLTYRSVFSAAVGIGAYYDAETDHTTGDLFNGSTALRNANSPLWLAQQPANRNCQLLIIVSTKDRDSYDGVFYADSRKMIAATQGYPGVSTITLRQGGHNFHVYQPTIPAALAWLRKTAAL